MKRFLLFVILSVFVSISYSQATYEGSFGKGIRMTTKDSTFSVKFGTRIQARMDFEYNPEQNAFQNRAMIRRARLKFDGFFINPNFVYKIEYDVVLGIVRDGVIKYRFKPQWQIWFGQTKLPGNRERIVSSANMQLVDRSIFNTFFTLDRDIGFQLRNHFTLGNVLIRDIIALSSGNGIYDLAWTEGVELTGKVEILPFGKFTKKGDYIGADIYREEKVKMSIALGADYNMKSIRTRGQLGSYTGETADLFLFSGDLLVKYRGISFMCETGYRSTPNRTAFVYDDEGLVTNAYYTGWGINFQGGYVFKSMWEVSGRYAIVRPNISFYNDRSDYTLGISRYIVGHKFKIQADFTYRTEVTMDDEFIGRLQLDFHF